MKKILVLGMLIMLLGACSPTATPSPEATLAPTDAPAPSYRIALVMKTLTNPYFIEMERGGRQAEAEFGIELIVRTAAQETSIQQQIEIIDSLIDENVDAIVIAPGDSVELIPILKRAQDAGIVIINIDNRLDPEFSDSLGLVDVPFISVNNEQGAYLAAKYIADQVTEPTQAIILEGIRAAQNAQDRKAGAIRAFGENANIEIVAMETANWRIDEAYQLIQTLLTTHPDVKLIFAANDVMAFGVIQYLQEIERTDILVAGFDALDEAKAALREGTLQITIDQQAALQGYTGVEFAIRRLRGETVPAVQLVDVLPVTAENVDN